MGMHWAAHPVPETPSLRDWLSEDLADHVISSIVPKKPARYRRAISYDSKEYYMRLASGNPAVFQDAIEENTVGETTQQEPEHGEDTIARVKG